MQGARAEIRHLNEPRGLRTLWFVLLAGPLAWVVGLMVDYSLVMVACSSGTVAALHLVSAATFGVALAGGVVGWRLHRRLGERWSGEGGGELTRSRFMVALGLLGSALFGLTILAQWLGKLFLHPCMGI